MNLNTHIKDLSGRQVALMVVGFVVLCGLIYYLVTREYMGTLVILALVLYFVGGYFAGAARR